MTLGIDFIMLCVSAVVLAVSLDLTYSQIAPTDVYRKYKFGYNIENKELLHKREEESFAEGHVTGQYSYMDPNGYIRTIRYNSTPETGFQVYGDTGVFPATANFINPMVYQPLLNQVQKEDGMNNNFIGTVFNGENRTNSLSLIPYATDPESQTLYHQITGQPANEKSEVSANQTTTSKNIENIPKPLNDFYFSETNNGNISLFDEPNGENISVVNEVGSGDAQFLKETQVPNEKAVADIHTPYSLPSNIAPYFIYPFPHFLPFHPDYRFIL